MLRHLLASAISAGALLAASSQPSPAAVATFDFEGQALGAATPLVTTRGGLTATFAGPPGVDPGAFEISYNSSSGPFPAPYRTLQVAFLTVGGAFGAAGSPLTISFSAPLEAVRLGFALDDASSTASLNLATNAGGTASARGALTSGFRYPEGVLSFSGAPFTSLTLSSAALSFQIDDIVATTTASATTVPEPISLGLLGAGLAGFAVVRRRAPNTL